MNQFLILASKSPRRKELLEDLGFQLEVIHSNVVEKFDGQYRTMEEKVVDIARRKAQAVAHKPEIRRRKKIVIASDTVVCIKEEVLGKPRDRSEAFEMLSKLSGQKHHVITATIIIDGEKEKSYQGASKTDVYFKKLNEREINQYLDQCHYMDKAGAYGIQNNGERLIQKIRGDYFNVMGLSISTVKDYFKEYYDFDLSMEKLLSKHGKTIKKLKSDGDNHE